VVFQVALPSVPYVQVAEAHEPWDDLVEEEARYGHGGSPGAVGAVVAVMLWEDQSPICHAGAEEDERCTLEADRGGDRRRTAGVVVAVGSHSWVHVASDLTVRAAGCTLVALACSSCPQEVVDVRQVAAPYLS
jgi:hypothetical protein